MCTHPGIGVGNATSKHASMGFHQPLPWLHNIASSGHVLHDVLGGSIHHMPWLGLETKPNGAIFSCNMASHEDRPSGKFKNIIPIYLPTTSLIHSMGVTWTLDEPPSLDAWAPWLLETAFGCAEVLHNIQDGQSTYVGHSSQSPSSMFLQVVRPS